VRRFQFSLAVFGKRNRTKGQSCLGFFFEGGKELGEYSTPPQQLHHKRAPGDDFILVLYKV